MVSALSAKVGWRQVPTDRLMDLVATHDFGPAIRSTSDSQTIRSRKRRSNSTRQSRIKEKIGRQLSTECLTALASKHWQGEV